MELAEQYLQTLFPLEVDVLVGSTATSINTLPPQPILPAKTEAGT